MMNYEASPFQDYESITIDELKDQANSLLNLVTEEQRPLRVCMNNGKEFLLFPQDLLAPICDSDFRLILQFVNGDRFVVLKRVYFGKRGKLLFNMVIDALESMGQSITEQEKRQIIMDILKELC